MLLLYTPNLPESDVPQAPPNEDHEEHVGKTDER